jgi:hypothetical protein
LNMSYTGLQPGSSVLPQEEALIQPVSTGPAEVPQGEVALQSAPSNDDEQKKRNLENDAAIAVNESGRGLFPSANPVVRGADATIQHDLQTNATAAQIQSDLQQLQAAEVAPPPPPPPPAASQDNSNTDSFMAGLMGALAIGGSLKAAGMSPLTEIAELTGGSGLYRANSQQQDSGLPPMG